jgi:hypothetical protein
LRTSINPIFASIGACRSSSPGFDLEFQVSVAKFARV